MVNCARPSINPAAAAHRQVGRRRYDRKRNAAPPATYASIPPGTRHPFRCGSTLGRVYTTLVPGGFDHGITEHGTPAPQVIMPPPGTSALHVWEQIAPGRPPAPGPGQQPTDVASW